MTFIEQECENIRIGFLANLRFCLVNLRTRISTKGLKQSFLQKNVIMKHKS